MRIPARRRWRVFSTMTCKKLRHSFSACRPFHGMYSFGYQITGNGRWVSMVLKRPKKRSGPKPKQPVRTQPSRDWVDSQVFDLDENEDGDVSNALSESGPPNIDHVSQFPNGSSAAREIPLPPQTDTDIDPDDPSLTAPLPRYNAMLAVLRNTLYMCVLTVLPEIFMTEILVSRYGGIFERGSKEYTLDDFYSLQLDKLDRYVCLKHSGITISEGDDESSDDEDDEDDEDDDDEDDRETATVIDDLDNESDVTDLETVAEELEVEKVSSLCWLTMNVQSR